MAQHFGNTADMFVDIMLNELASVEGAAPTLPRAHGRVATRHQIDVCLEPSCGVPCKNHQWQGYVECFQCRGRRSIDHLPTMKTPANKNKGHAKLDLRWLCVSCKAKRQQP